MGRIARKGGCSGPLSAASAVLLLVLSMNCQPSAGSGAAEGAASARAYDHWGNDTLAVPEQGHAGQPSMASCPDGSIHVVWADGREGGPRLYYKKLDHSGRTLVADRKLADDALDSNFSRPRAVGDRYGNLHVLWLGNHVQGAVPEGFGLDINHMFLSTAGINYTDRISNHFCVTIPEYPYLWAYRNLSAAMMPEGNLSLVFEVAWSNMVQAMPPSSYPTIGWMKLASNGTKLSESGLNTAKHDPFEVPRSQRNPAVAASADNRVHVFWIDESNSELNLLRWSVINETGPTPQGGMVLPGRLGIGLGAVLGPGSNISVLFLDSMEPSLNLLSYSASQSPLGSTPQRVYRTDYMGIYNGTKELEPRVLGGAACDGQGNILAVCDGAPVVGASIPENIGRAAGLFIIRPDGSVLLGEPQFVSETFDAMSGTPFPEGRAILEPCVASSPQDQAYVAWSLSGRWRPPLRTAGIYIRGTSFNDLGVGRISLNYSGPYPFNNTTVSVEPLIQNRGVDAASDFLVTFLVDGVSQGAADLSLPAGSSTSPRFNWTAALGNHSLTVRLDPRGNPDADPTNNNLTIHVYIFVQPDLYVFEEDISFSNEYPVSGEELAVTAGIHNRGELAGEAKVNFYIDDAFLAARDIMVQPFNVAPAQAVWRALPGNHTVKVEVYGCSPPEGNFSNNAASRAVSVREGPPVELPDITILEPLPNSVVNGVVTARGVASTRYPEAGLSVECRSGGQPWRTADGGAEWNFLWNTAALPDGMATLEAKATSRGVSRTASVRVEVRNAVVPRLWFASFNPPGNASIFEGERAFYRAEPRSEPAPMGQFFFDWRLDGATVSAGNDLGNYTYSSDFRSAGLHRITLSVFADFPSGRQNASLAWNLTVVNVNQPPVIERLSPGQSPVKFRKGAAPVFQVVASDPDGDALNYSWSLDGRLLARTGGPFLRPGGIGAGGHNLTVNVSDGQQGAFGSWSCEVSGSDEPTVRNDTGICLALVLVAVIGAAGVVLIRRRAQGAGRRD